MAPQRATLADSRFARVSAGHTGVVESEHLSPDDRRKVRQAVPPIMFIGGLLVLATIVTAVIIAIWATGGFGGEGTEGLGPSF
jgi:hypothetical protein